MPDFLVASIVLSVVLTIVVNAVLWLFPSSGRRVDEGMQRLAERKSGSFDARYARPQRSRVHVIFPWKAMLIGSIVLTIVLNMAIVLFD